MLLVWGQEVKHVDVSNAATIVSLIGTNWEPSLCDLVA